MNQNERVQAQKEFCKKKDYPLFMPGDGICWRCGGDMTSQNGDDCDKKHITGCSHCLKTYCD